MRPRPVTASLAAAGLIAGYGVAVATGSRPLGGVVLAACAVACVAIWMRRHEVRAVALLAAGGVVAFALSHALGMLIGAWPAVIVTAFVAFVAYWRFSDSGHQAGGRSEATVGA